MKEIFDELLVMLDEMKRAAIQSCDYYAARNYQRIQAKIIELHMKYNESLRKEPVAAKNTEMTALEYCLKGGVKMDAVKFLKEKKRMCDSFRDSSCEGCLIYAIDIGTGCFDFQGDHPKQTVEIVEKWAEEHPRKTILQDFLEKYPNAIMEDGGFPELCPYHLGYEKEPTDNDEFCNAGEDGCRKCWNRQLDEVK